MYFFFEVTVFIFYLINSYWILRKQKELKRDVYVGEITI